MSIGSLLQKLQNQSPIQAKVVGPTRRPRNTEGKDCTCQHSAAPTGPSPPAGRSTDSSATEMALNPVPPSRCPLAPHSTSSRERSPSLLKQSPPPEPERTLLPRQGRPPNRVLWQAP